jgi:REP element-mobilizing transposase RayT
MKQEKLFAEKSVHQFGGSLLAGSRKTVRPLTSKKPVHLVLKATNSFQLIKNKKLVEFLTHKYAHKFGIKVYEKAVHADHIHLAVQVPNRILYVRWIRALTSVLVKRIRNLKWKLRPYTRVADWGRPFRNLKKYIFGNRLEGDFMAAANARVDHFFETHVGWLFEKPGGSPTP